MLPDRRLRVTRVYDVINLVPKTPEELLAEVWLPWGAQDEKFTNCRLVKQDVLGQPKDFPDDKKPPYLVRVWEEIPATAEQQVGNPGVVVNQYGFKDVTLTYIQFSAGTATFQVPGTTPAPSPYQYCILKEQAFTDDGTLRTIRRTYSEGGLLADNEELKFGGRLKLRTLKSLNVIPHTPDGYTLITESTEYVNGLPLYSYGYASASSDIGLGGKISEGTQYNMSPDQGTTGVTVKSITWLTDLTVSSNPIPSPGAGYQLIESDYDDRDGYRVWTAKFAKGTGVISSDVDTRDGGKLIVYSKTSINAVPPTPSATIGGTVTLISAKVRNGTDAANGTIIYDYTWAEGLGEVSREVRYSQSSDQGTTGVTVITIRYLAALATASNPISTPSGTLLISEGSQLQDGYRVWTATYAKGTGEVSRDFTNSQGGPTDFDPANPTDSLGIVICTIRYLTAASVTTDPTSPPAGFKRFSIDHSESDGYRVWSVKTAYGSGVVQERSSPREGGIRLVSWTSFGMSAGTATFVPPGIPITMDYELVDGAVKWDVTCMQSLAGGDPTAGIAQLFSDYLDFTYPGRAKPFTATFPLHTVGTGYIYDVYKSPPIGVKVEATVKITYQTGDTIGALDYPLWNPTEWAALRAFYQGTDGYAKAEVTSLYGYIAVGTSLFWTAPAYPSSVAVLGVNAMQLSDGSIEVVGGPSDPGGTTVTLAAKLEPAFIDFWGQQYYRRTVIEANIPVQSALPV